MSLQRRFATFTEAFSLLRRAAPRLAAVSLVIDLIGAVARAAMLGIAGRILALLSEDATWEQAVPWLVAATIALAIGMVSSSVHGEVIELATERIEAHAVGRVLESAAQVPYEAFDGHEFYDRLQRAYESGAFHAWSIVKSTLSLVRSVLDLVAIGLVLAYVAPILIPISALAFVPLWLVSIANNRDRYQFSWDETEPDRRRRYIESLLSERQPAKEVRAFSIDQALLGEFRTLWDARLHKLARVVRGTALRSAFGHFLSSIVVTGALSVVVWLTINGDLSLAQAGVGVLGVRQISGSVNGVVDNIRSLHKSHQFLNDYRDFRAEASQWSTEGPDEPGPTTVSTIVFENVSFTYPGAKHPTIQGLDLTIRNGEVTAVVGANGAGKTTLLMLLAGMYRPTAGRILWDGVDTAEYSPRQRYQTVGPLFQDFVHFHFTVAENVAPTGGDADKISAALDLAGAGGYSAALPKGVATQLGKSFTSGAELSIGQWQRLALARALYCNAPIVLLDEPASALDPGAEFRLVQTLQSTMRTQCVVMISHRFASVRQADTIIVLDEGRLIESGTHDELVALSGTYNSLYRAQADPLLGSSAKN